MTILSRKRNTDSTSIELHNQIDVPTTVVPNGQQQPTAVVVSGASKRNPQSLVSVVDYPANLQALPFNRRNQVQFQYLLLRFLDQSK